MSDLDNTLTTKPKCDQLTKVLTRIILPVIALPLFICGWIYVNPASFKLTIMNTSKFIRYEILGEQRAIDGHTQMTDEQTKQFFRSLSDEELQKMMSPEMFKRWKETGEFKAQ